MGFSLDCSAAFFPWILHHHVECGSRWGPTLHPSLFRPKGTRSCIKKRRHASYRGIRVNWVYITPQPITGKRSTAFFRIAVYPACHFGPRTSSAASVGLSRGPMLPPIGFMAGSWYAEASGPGLASGLWRSRRWPARISEPGRCGADDTRADSCILASFTHRVADTDRADTQQTNNAILSQRPMNPSHKRRQDTSIMTLYHRPKRMAAQINLFGPHRHLLAHRFSHLTPVWLA
jgi:hypothetical protein